MKAAPADIGPEATPEGARRPDARKTALRPSLMKLFKLPSQARAVKLRAAQQILMKYARLKSS
jgi:hypothetical protein